MPRHLLRRNDGPGFHKALCLYIIVHDSRKAETRAGKKAHWVECLPHKHKDLCLIPRVIGLTVHVYIPRVEEAENEGSFVAHWSTSLAGKLWVQ